MNPIILIFGNIFGGLPDSLTGPAEIFVEGKWDNKTRTVFAELRLFVAAHTIT